MDGLQHCALIVTAYAPEGVVLIVEKLSDFVPFPLVIIRGLGVAAIPFAGAPGIVAVTDTSELNDPVGWTVILVGTELPAVVPMIDGLAKTEKSSGVEPGGCDVTSLTVTENVPGWFAGVQLVPPVDLAVTVKV
jgi:hypothetical protein